MGPKAAVTPQQAAKRPQTPNDLAIIKTEAALDGISAVEAKWLQRLTHSTKESDRNALQTSSIETGIIVARRLLDDLDAAVVKLVAGRADGELKEDKGKKQGKSPEPPAGPQYRPEDIRDMTNLLLKFYRFEPPSGAKLPAPQPSLVASIKQEVAKAVASLPRDDSAPPRTAKAYAAATDTSGIEIVPHGVLPLQVPRGIDKAIWDELMHLRSKRVMVREAVSFFEREKQPIGVRKGGLISMKSVTQYALDAVSRERKHLSTILRDQETVRANEVSAWTDQTQSAPAPAKAKGK